MTDDRTADARDRVLRTVLPIPDRPHRGLVTYDAKDPDTSFPPIVPLRPPAGAPNVLIILLDDVGFGAAGTFGGPVATPTADRLAAGGLRYRRFHTTALCSPSRAALLTGRNHHTVGMGAVADLATAAPGYTSMRPNTCAPLAEILRLNGYATAQFGKCHEVPTWESSPLGPFDRWPTGSGFEHFYGFVAGETHQYAPALYQDTVPVEPPDDPAYHLTEDLAQRCIDWIRQQKSLMPDKPFFAYLAPGATHAPHHVWPEWAERYRGRFNLGWDHLRRETFELQKHLGVIPPEAELTERPAEIPAWDDMPEALKPILARQMEIYAGFLEHADHHMGRVDPGGRRARPARRHPRLLHHRRQRRLGRGAAQRLLQRAAHLQRDGGVRDARVPGVEDRRTSAAPTPTTTTPWAGPTPWTRRTSGPSRWPRTGAGRATGSSCTGPGASAPPARRATSSTT